MIFPQGFIKFDQGISEKCVEQTFGGRKKERKKERRIRNGANTICLPFGGHNKNKHDTEI